MCNDNGEEPEVEIEFNDQKLPSCPKCGSHRFSLGAWEEIYREFDFENNDWESDSTPGDMKQVHAVVCAECNQDIVLSPSMKRAIDEINK